MHDSVLLYYTVLRTTPYDYRAYLLLSLYICVYYMLYADYLLSTKSSITINSQVVYFINSVPSYSIPNSTRYILITSAFLYTPRYGRTVLYCH